MTPFMGVLYISAAKKYKELDVKWVCHADSDGIFTNNGERKLASREASCVGLYDIITWSEEKIVAKSQSL